MTLSFNRQLLLLLLLLPLGIFATFFLILENPQLLAIILGGSIVALIAFFYPAILLGLLIISTLLQEVMFVSVAEIVTLNQLVGLILFFILIIKALVKKELFNSLSHPISFALLALLGVLIYSYLLFSVGKENPLQVIEQFYRGLIYFFICLLVIRSKNDLIVITFSYIIAGIIIGISGYFWQTISSPLDYLTHGRQGIYGITYHYIEYAFRCMIPLSVVAYSLLSKRILGWPFYLIFWVSLIILSMATLLSGARGAILAYFFMLIIFVLMGKATLLKKTGLVALLSLIPIFLPIDELLYNLTNLAKGYYPYDPSSSFRANLIHIALIDLKSFDFGSLLWGRGLENFRDYFSGTFNPPHSMWLQSLYELGIIGLGIQLYIVYKIFQAFLKLLNNRSISPEKTLTLGWGASIFVIFFWGLYENIGLMLGTKHLFIMIGLFIAGNRLLMPQRNHL